MARSHIGRFSGGKNGLGKVFKRSYKLRHYLSPKAKKEALKTLGKYRSGGGIETGKELRRAYGQWRRNTGDNISKAEARMIKRELREYAKDLETDTHHKRASGAYFRTGHDELDHPTSDSQSPAARESFMTPYSRRTSTIHIPELPADGASAGIQLPGLAPPLPEDEPAGDSDDSATDAPASSDDDTPNVIYPDSLKGLDSGKE